MGSSLRFGVICVALVACGGKKDEAGQGPDKDKDREVPIRIAFSDCTSSPVPFVSGPRPQPLQAEEGEAAARDDAKAPDVGANAPAATGQAGVLGNVESDGGAFASLTGTGDRDSGFDDTNIYGGLLGDGADSGGGFGLRGTGSGGGGTGSGTIGIGRHGTIGHGGGYGVGGGHGMRGRRNDVPRTSIGQPNAQGDLDKAIIRRFIRRNIQKFQYCYEKQLLSNPKLAGTVQVQFFIAPSGNVANATASGVDPEVASCVADVVKGIEFPKPRGGGGVQVNYPFTFRLAEGSLTAPAAPAGAGSAAGSDSGSSPASPPPAPPPPPPPVAGPYQPGAHDPLRQVEPALAACLRGATSGATFGAMIVDLELDPKTGQATKATPGTTDTKLAACIAAAARTVKLDTPGPKLQRCGFAYGVMPVTAVPAIAITATDVTFNGKIVDHPSKLLADSSSSWKIAALFEALDAWQKQPPPQGTVPIRGPGLLEPLDQTPMKIVTNALSTAYAAAADFVLAARRGQAWVPLRGGIVLPVAPVPLGSGGTWNGTVIARGGRPTATDERVELSVLVAKQQIWVGLSRVNEFQEITGRDFAKLEQVLKEHKASAFFADRGDVEIAGEDDVVYGDVVETIELATKVGFTDWKVLPPAGLAARPRL